MYNTVNPAILCRILYSALAAGALGVALHPGAPRAAEQAEVLPEAPAKALVLRACANCHQPSEIVAKRRTPEDWDAVIAKMVDRGAQLTEVEEEQVYTYLVANFGAPADGRPGG